MITVVIHYSGEIGSKGANRRMFEKKLKDNIRSALRKENYETIKIANSRIFAILNPKVVHRLKNVPGIGYYAVLDRKLGANQESFEGKTYYFSEKIQGQGGLPVGVSGKLVALISGGIDSPVAAYRMMRRGCSISLVHFFNPTQHKQGVMKKIEDLARILARHQFKTRLYIVRFDAAQREIIAKVPAKYRMIVYRRYMLRIGEGILEKEGAKGFVTGDSLAQVASQTIDNISIIYKASDYPVFSPLIGEDKDTIISQAKQLGTFRISILPYDDCCSFFVAQHPETRAALADILQVESQIDPKAIVAAAQKSIDVRTFMS